METLNITNGEPIIDLRLTQTELNTIVAHFGMAGYSEAIEYSESWGIKISKDVDATSLYSNLKILMNKLKYGNKQ